MLNISGIQGKTGRILRSALSLLPRNITLPILQGPARGKWWKRESGVDGYWLGSYEFGLQQEFQKHLKGGTVFYDVGAQAGFYTLLAGAVAKESASYAFEPDERNFKFLTWHIKRNRLKAKAFNYAITNKDGTVRFASGDNVFTGHIDDEGTPVPCRSIDSLVKNGEIKPPSLMKIDVEGHTKEVLEGAKQTIETYRPTIIAECTLEDLKVLPSSYRINDIEGNNIIAVPRGKNGKSETSDI